MKETLEKRVIEPIAFLAVYLIASLLGSAAYAVGWQFVFERGRPPNELGGWFSGSCFVAAATMLNLCALNQLLILTICLWPRLRRSVGFRFAVLAGLVFGALPLTIKAILRESSGHRITIMNNTATEYALSWIICGVIFVALAWLCYSWKVEKKKIRTIACKTGSRCGRAEGEA